MREESSAIGERCPACGHPHDDEQTTRGEWGWLLRRPKVVRCGHWTVWQDAVADDDEQCLCDASWHRRG